MQSDKLGRVERAIIFATNALNGQKDKVGQPAIFHSLHVGNTVGPYEPDQVVAFLHDVPEDTGISVAEVASVVGLTFEEQEALTALTHKPNVPYIDYIKGIKASNQIARNVKIADIKHNMSRNMDQLPIEDKERMQKKYKMALQVLED